MQDDRKDERPKHSVEPEPRRKSEPDKHEVEAPSRERTDDETDGKTTVRQE